MEKIEVDDVFIYDGDVFNMEKNRPQLVKSITIDGNYITKFVDTEDLNIINPNSGYFTSCKVIPGLEHKLNLTNGIPINWGDEN
jgi:hypothetical protein